jgi:hypothetical protein
MGEHARRLHCLRDRSDLEESKAEEEDEKKPAARNGFSFWRKREAGACAPVRGLRSRSETHVTGASA